jgi:hypothetical protein
MELELLVKQTVSHLRTTTGVGSRWQLTMANVIDVLSAAMQFAGRFRSLRGEERKQLVLTAMRLLAEADGVISTNEQRALDMLAEHYSEFVESLFKLQPYLYKTRKRCRAVLC